MLALTSTGCASSTTPSTTTSAPTSVAASPIPANDPAGKEQLRAANLQAVGTAIAATGTAAGNLFTKLKTACGS